MPNNQALQVFYGTIPLILVFAALYFREQLLLKDILARLGGLEKTVSEMKDEFRNGLSRIKERLAVLETRAGVIFSGD